MYVLILYCASVCNHAPEIVGSYWGGCDDVIKSIKPLLAKGVAAECLSVSTTTLNAPNNGSPLWLSSPSLTTH
jgi:hypothetical protein